MKIKSTIAIQYPDSILSILSLFLSLTNLFKNRQPDGTEKQDNKNDSPHRTHPWIVVNVLIDGSREVTFPPPFMPLRGVGIEDDGVLLPVPWLARRQPDSRKPHLK